MDKSTNVLSCDDEDSQHDDSNAGGRNEGHDKYATHCLYKRIVDLTSDDIKGLEFSSEDHAFEFYTTYAKCHGFIVRKKGLHRDDNGKIIKRLYVCNREGVRDKKHFMRLDRKKEHRPITRTNCQAKIRVYLDLKTSKWKVSSFIESHNHELTLVNEVHNIPKYHMLTTADKAQVDSLHAFDVRTCHIMRYLLAQKGGYSGIGFLKSDLYNHFHHNQHDIIKDGDVCVALSYLEGKACNDPMFYSKYQTIDDGMLKHLFWADGLSRSDFPCFSYALAFNTTYKKNKYNNPLVIFSGCNHHSQTVIFGCALLADETTDTYKWVLKAFLDAMHDKHPISIITDGDGAMREAIKFVFPNSSHRLCAWHLHKNAIENVKKSDFLEDFQIAIYSNFTPNEFEEFWKKIVSKHGLQGNKWVTKTYEIRTLWSTAYFRDKFFGCIRITSQCETINALIKLYVRRKSTIIEFIQSFDRVVREYRHNEHLADFKDSYAEPVLTISLYNFEQHGSKIYTMEIFKEVNEELIAAGTYNIVERLEDGDKLLYKMKMYSNPKKEVSVVYDIVNTKLLCGCHLCESRGISCSHIFVVLKNEFMTNIPTSLICKRWMKTTKTDLVC